MVLGIVVANPYAYVSKKETLLSFCEIAFRVVQSAVGLSDGAR